MPAIRNCLLASLLAAFGGLSLCAQGSAAAEQQFQQALDAQKRGDYNAAIGQYQDLLKSSPGLVSAWVNLGVSQVQTGKFQEAVHSYQSALALNPDNQRIQYYLALAYFKSGDSGNACRGFEQLLHANPKDFHLAALLATSELQAGDNPRALTTLQPLVAEAGNDPDFVWALALAQIANGNLHEGVEAAEKVAQQNHSAEAWKLAGENSLRLNDFPRAKDDLEAAARGNPDLPALQTVLGQAREKNADYEGAITAFQRAVAQNPNDFAAWLNLGSDQYFTRDLAGARESLGRALALKAESAPALYELALVDKTQGDTGGAIVKLEKVVKLSPAWREAHIQLAALYIQAHRMADGQREREVVDRLDEEERKAGPAKY
jgi:tetratricopeptide (TPR) repeat protein